MKYLIALVMILAVQNCFAQNDEDAEPLMQPKILALDTSLSVANRFNEEIGKVAEGYSFVFTDKSFPKTIRQVYKTENNETLRLEYKYGINEGDSEDNNGKPVVTYQRITGEAGLVIKIYNYLFGTNYEATQITVLSTPGMEISYHGEVHQFVLEADEYTPGYWAMSFVR
jgi:hypothetical protein